jgi:hypothetical protein
MNYLRNEKGFAMVFVLILAAISLAMTLAMLIMVSRGSYVSGQQKRFRTAVEACRGGMEAMFQMIATQESCHPYTNRRCDPGALGIKLAGPVSPGGADNSAPTHARYGIDYDMQNDLGRTACTQTVDTVTGNSGSTRDCCWRSPHRLGRGTTVVSVRIFIRSVLSQSQTNSTERSKLSVLYQY